MCNPVDMQNDFSTERQTMDRWVSVYVSFYNATGAQWLTVHSMLKTRLMIEPETSTRQKFLLQTSEDVYVNFEQRLTKLQYERTNAISFIDVKNHF